MARRSSADERVGATESKLYLPAGSNPSFVVSRLERVWGTLFNHGVEAET